MKTERFHVKNLRIGDWITNGHGRVYMIKNDNDILEIKIENILFDNLGMFPCRRFTDEDEIELLKQNG